MTCVCGQKCRQRYVDGRLQEYQTMRRGGTVPTGFCPPNRAFCFLCTISRLNMLLRHLLRNNSCFDGPVILATGHSARDVYKMLRNSGIALEPKGIAVGVRLEFCMVTRIAFMTSGNRSVPICGWASTRISDDAPWRYSTDSVCGQKCRQRSIWI